MLSPKHDLASCLTSNACLCLLCSTFHITCDVHPGVHSSRSWELFIAIALKVFEINTDGGISCSTHISSYLGIRGEWHEPAGCSAEQEHRGFRESGTGNGGWHPCTLFRAVWSHLEQLITPSTLLNSPHMCRRWSSSNLASYASWRRTIV